MYIFLMGLKYVFLMQNMPSYLLRTLTHREEISCSPEIRKANTCMNESSGCKYSDKYSECAGLHWMCVIDRVYMY